MNNPSKPRLLIVDDEEPIRRLCERSLAGSDYLVDTARNAAEALQLFRLKAFDIILTDLSMPGSMNGEGLLEEIKRRSPTTDVIIMTGYPTLDTAIPTLKQGAYDYLIKPFDQAVLKSVIARCAEKRQLSSELNREKRLREDLVSAYAQLKELEQLKEAFLARVNHEFRIPLVPALLAVDLLSQSIQDPEGRGLCRMLGERLNQLRDLVESLMLFSQLKKPDLPVTPTPVHMKNMLTDLIKRYRSEWEERELSVELDIEPGTEEYRGDARLTETIFKQLFLNAIYFNHRQGRIMIRARKKDDVIEMVFEDTGIGIPQNQLSKVFDSFYQVADYLTREVGGIGLGLALVKRILETQGGSITVKSQEGMGSQFIVHFPVTVAPKVFKEAVLQ